MELTEEQAYTALGVTPEKEEPQSEKKPEAAAPAQEQKTEETGEKAPETADPVQEQQKPEQTEAERHVFAARRRQAEQKAAVDEAVEAALKAEREKASEEWSTFFRKAGLKNPATGKPITSRDEFDAWARGMAPNEGREELTRESLEKAIEESPALKKLGELLQEQEAAKKAEADKRAQAVIAEELQKIHALDPSINTIDDLLKMPEAEAWEAYVDKGNSFLDAYYLATRERQMRQTGAQAKQEAINKARSKDHLTPVGGSKGKGAVSVPKDVMELYKTLMPKATEAEIQAHYNRLHKDE